MWMSSRINEDGDWEKGMNELSILKGGERVCPFSGNHRDGNEGGLNLNYQQLYPNRLINK